MIQELCAGGGEPVLPLTDWVLSRPGVEEVHISEWWKVREPQRYELTCSAWMPARHSRPCTTATLRTAARILSCVPRGTRPPRCSERQSTGGELHVRATPLTPGTPASGTCWTTQRQSSQPVSTRRSTTLMPHGPSSGVMTTSKCGPPVSSMSSSADASPPRGDDECAHLPSAGWSPVAGRDGSRGGEAASQPARVAVDGAGLPTVVQVPERMNIGRRCSDVFD